MHRHCRAEILLLVILILTGHLSVALKKKAVLQQQMKPLPTLCYTKFVSDFCCSAIAFRFFPVYFIPCPADHMGMLITSAEEDSHEGCLTRNKGSFLFSICSLRSWCCGSPMSPRSLQPEWADGRAWLFISWIHGGITIQSKYLGIQDCHHSLWLPRSDIKPPTLH